MSILSGNIDKIIETKYFVSKIYPAEVFKGKDNSGVVKKFKKPNGNPLQLTVFSNVVEISYGSVDHNGLPVNIGILPFPIRKNGINRFELLDMNRYPGIFDDLEMLFEESETNSIMDTSFNNSNIGTIGQYKILVKNSYAKLMESNRTEYNIPNELMEKIQIFYRKNYAFVVCIMDRTAIYNPMGFIHELAKNDRLFIPLKSLHSQGNISHVSAKFARGLTEERDIDQFRKDIITLNDDFLRYNTRRNEKTESRELYRKYTIYLCNYNNLLKHRFLNEKGVSIIPPNEKRSKSMDDYISTGNFPDFITFNGIKKLACLQVSPLWNENHDLYV